MQKVTEAVQRLIRFDAIPHLASSLLHVVTLNIHLAFQELKIQIQILLHSCLNVSTSEKGLGQVIMHETIVRKSDCPRCGVTFHNAALHRVRRKAKTERFQGVPLLPAFGAHNMMELSPVISESQFACAAMRSLKIGEERPDIMKTCDRITYLDTTTIIFSRGFSRF